MGTRQPVDLETEIVGEIAAVSDSDGRGKIRTCGLLLVRQAL